MLHRKLSISRYQALPDCSSPYTAFFNLHTKLTWPCLIKPCGCVINTSSFMLPFRYAAFTSRCLNCHALRAAKSVIIRFVFHFTVGEKVSSKSILGRCWNP
uniref:Uncharacterized protein n=1 Tax=Physcomitrium patens TaxID=3218 RepID=A0A2K1K6N3_PHYPA|nr:hypothetical protein PHYPA_011328 [Physcomitrium patens]